MNKAFEIWFADDRAKTGMLIPVDEIEQKIPTFGDACVYRLDEAATDERIAEINGLLKDWVAEHEFKWYRQSDVEEFLEENGIAFEVKSDDYYTPDGKIVYCQGEFGNEDYYDTFAVYTWWDGSSWQNVDRPEPSDDGSYEEVEYDTDDEQCLDEWNGSNYTSGSNGIHHYVVRLGDNRNLMIYRSQWQGEHDEAQIMTDAEYAEYRKERNLDD